MNHRLGCKLQLMTRQEIVSICFRITSSCAEIKNRLPPSVSQNNDNYINGDDEKQSDR